METVEEDIPAVSVGMIDTGEHETQETIPESALVHLKMDEIPLHVHRQEQGDTETKPLATDIEDEELKTVLMYTKHMKIEVKDIHNEVRALREVERFLERPTILLNIQETRLEDIIEAMLIKLIARNEGCVVDEEEARNAFFTKDSIHHLSHVIQGTEKSEGSGWEETQNWLIAMAELPWLNSSYVAMSTLRHATNLGRTLQETHLVVLILAPRKTKRTKSSLETGRTFATILSDMEIRQQLIAAESEIEFVNVLQECKESLVSGAYQRKKHLNVTRKSSFIRPTHSQEVRVTPKETSQFAFCRGIKDDVMRRLPHYSSDFYDGVTGHHTLQKLASTVLFLYFACLLPSIAFGVLNSKNTNGKIGVKQVIIAQSVSGVLYSLLSGQPLIILLTTAPLALYVKLLYNICEDMDLDFYAMYTMTGLWNTFFLILFSVFGASYVMRWSTRSINEIFALFISVAFTVASLDSMYKEYNKPICYLQPSSQ